MRSERRTARQGSASGLRPAGRSEHSEVEDGEGGTNVLGHQQVVPTLLLIDPTSISRECLSRTIGHSMPDVRVVAAADPAVDAKCEIDLILLNVKSHSVTEDAIRSELEQLRKRHLAARFLVLCEECDADEVAAALRAGFDGCFSGSESLELLLAAIKLVLLGGTFVPAELVARLKGPAMHRQQTPISVAPRCDDMFTVREREVLLGLRAGKPNKVIAYDLNIASSTVKVHIRNIMKKLNATNRTQVVMRSEAQSASA